MKLNRELIEGYRQRWLKTRTIDDMEEVRSAFFSLPFSLETLERFWDYISIGEGTISFRTRQHYNYIDLDFEEVESLRKKGLTYNQIADKLNCSQSKITSFYNIEKRKRGIK